MICDALIAAYVRGEFNKKSTVVTKAGYRVRYVLPQNVSTVSDKHVSIGDVLCDNVFGTRVIATKEIK